MKENYHAAAKRFTCVALEVNLREHVTPISHLNKATHSDFEIQRRHRQKSGTGVLVASQKTYVL